MPFLTEEIWQHIAERASDEALIISTWPQILPVNKNIIKEFDFASEVISGIRTIRKQKNIAFKEAIQLLVLNNEKSSKVFDVIISKLGHISNVTYADSKNEGALSFRVKSNEYFIPIDGVIDVDEEIAKLTAELNYSEGFLVSVRKKLANERFVNNAPESVVKSEKKKEADTLAKIETLKASLSNII